jgi:hypothetical protein
MLPIPGTTSKAHLEENVASASLCLGDGETRANQQRGRLDADPGPTSELWVVDPDTAPRPITRTSADETGELRRADTERRQI